MKSHSAAHAVNKNLQFCNEPFSCSCCNQYLMFWSNKMKSYSAAIAVNKNLQFMQYTLSTLLSSFPWTTQKSIIVENSKIVENFGATIFSTIMEFDCIFCRMAHQRDFIVLWLLNTRTLDQAQFTLEGYIDPKYTLFSSQGVQLSGEVPCVKFEWLV